VTKTDCRVPVISNPDEFNIPWQTLQTIIAGRSLIDVLELHIDHLDDAHRFLSAYGLNANKDFEKLRNTALKYIEEVLLNETDHCLPEIARNLSLPELLVEASNNPKTPISEWSCMILKVCHAVAHARWARDEDAYNGALIKIKSRIKPYLVESQDGIWVGDDNCRIPIIEYSIKSEKLFFRLVTKLLLKEGNLSAQIFDHIGMRFVTNDIFSAILLVKFLRSRHIFMYANIVPQQSKNSLAEFHQIEALFSEFNGPIHKSVTQTSKNTWVGSENRFSSKKFKMIKIVERILVTTPNGRKVFFPCEIQILTKQTYDSLHKKKMKHSEYEKRQVKGVKRRLFNGTSLCGRL
jgi:uncharacterized protein (TIGR04562 family)